MQPYDKKIRVGRSATTVRQKTFVSLVTVIYHSKRTIYSFQTIFIICTLLE